MNEYLGSTNSPSGASSYLVHDDADSGFAILRQDLVQGLDEDDINRVALRAAPSIGDVDGDGLGEVLLGGVRNFARWCNTQEYLVIAFEDAEHGLADLAVHPYIHFFQDCSSPADPQIRYVHLHALDIDGDGRDEVQANQFIFEDFVESAPWTVNTAWTIPEDYIWNQGNFGHVDSTTSSFVVGDFTGDDREDIAFYVQDEPIARVWGVHPIDGAGVQRDLSVAFYNSQTPRNPVLLAANADMDSPVLRYSEGTYRQVFSEPMIVAALAAPPCQEGIGQNIDACSTEFGNTSTTGSETERAVSVSAGATIGVKIEGGAATQSEAEFKESATVAASRVTSESYELSRTILFTSGPAEDLVVVTTIPLDVYEYTLLSHPDPEMVGRPIVVSLPRDPITLQVDRDYFNRSLQDGVARVDHDVFVHTIGDISSYSSKARKDQLLALHDGLDVGPVSVGQGAGSTSVSMEVAEEITEGQSLEVSFETEVEATVGTILGGFTVGTSVGNSLSITAGESTSYTGTVGAIDEDHFAEERFDFGLFTYVYTDPLTGREFEVLDYWVE